MTFGKADFLAIRSALTSIAKTLGVFDKVGDHEPKNSPGTGLSCVVFGASIEPLGAASGLRATSGRVEFRARIYGLADKQPLRGVDPDVFGAACDLIAAWSADFELGGLIRNLDLLGQHGAPLGAEPGYLEQDGTFYRVMDLTVPCIVNDFWDQVP